MAITRAKKNLIITHATTRFEGDKVRELNPSQFLSEFDTKKFNYQEANEIKNPFSVPKTINDELEELLNL